MNTKNPNDYLIHIPIRGPVRIPLQPSWWQRLIRFFRGERNAF